MIALPVLRLFGTAMSALVAVAPAPVLAREIVQVHRATQNTSRPSRMTPLVMILADSRMLLPTREGEGWQIMQDYADEPMLGDLEPRYHPFGAVRGSIRNVAADRETGRRMANWPRVQRAASGY